MLPQIAETYNTMPYEDPTVSTALMIGWVLIFLIVIFLGIAAYLYTALTLMFIAKRTNTPNSWLAFIPVANVYIMTQIGKIHWAWTFGILLGIIPLVGKFISAIYMVFLWWKIAEARGKPGWWGILMIIPIVNFIMMAILAWGKK